MAKETSSPATKAAKPTAKSATKTVKKAPAVAMVEFEGSSYLDMRRAPDDVRNQFLSALQEVMGYHHARKYDYLYPMSELAGFRDSVANMLQNDWGVDISSNTSKYRPIFTFLDEFIQEVKTQLAGKVAGGSIEFGDLPYLLSKGTEVTGTFDNEEIGGKVEACELVRTFAGVYYNVKFKVISNAHGHLDESIFTMRVGPWSGLREINKLVVRPILEEEKARLTERGEIYRKYAVGAHYVYYTGQLTRSSWWSDRKFRADGRIMIDVNSFQQIDNEQFGNESRASGLEDDGGRRGESSKANIAINDEDLWRTFPFIYGFSFAAKQWGRMSVSGVSDINWRTDAFEKLVLDAADKELVRVIVEDDASDFSDLIEGKGGGSIFLLHGPPGQGKTLTAEAIAEELRRPLYSISVGELGVSPDELESTLREILDVATIWNAVLLLDEADIFLEARDEKDIVRNAMVGVFLRLLEYHQGVLFLTTNRVKNIDQAFYSRISIGLRFTESDREKRTKIWTNLLEAAKVTGINVPSLAEHDVNGRQIKNIIKLSIKLARSKGHDVDNATIESVIDRTTKFQS